MSARRPRPTASVLDEMRIQDLGVISDATLDLSPGLTVVTGETGAGKTMVVSGLALLLGGRADSAAVRADAASAVVEGRFLVARDGPVAARAAQAGAEVEDVGGDEARAELIVARSVQPTGRSRAHLGGRGVPVAVLAELADHLVTVHGQSDQLLLRSPARQREVLDTYGGPALVEVLGRYQSDHERRQAVQEELTRITTQARERAQEAAALGHGLAEIERVDPQPGEDVALHAEAEWLENIEDLRAGAGTARDALSGPDDTAQTPVDVLALVETARRALQAAAGHDEQLDGLARRLVDLEFGLADVAGELSTYLAALDADPARLEHVQRRRADLAALTRAYGDDVDAVLQWGREAAARLGELDGDDDRIVALTAERDDLDARLEAAAADLHDQRVVAGQALSRAVSEELAALAMPHARFEVVVERAAALGPHGGDEVSMRLAPHPGAEPRPLGKGASGGELSRVMLALEVVLAGGDAIVTFVFDEVDSGVGGKAAVEIGRRLARLARTAQVVVVTHLPQVAAFADRHLVVVKADDGRITRSGVHALDDAGRVRELARMLAGQEDSASAREHARELLEGAAAEWSGARVDVPGGSSTGS